MGFIRKEQLNDHSDIRPVRVGLVEHIGLAGHKIYGDGVIKGLVGHWSHRRRIN